MTDFKMKMIATLVTFFVWASSATASAQVPSPPQSAHASVAWSHSAPAPDEAAPAFGLKQRIQAAAFVLRTAPEKFIRVSGNLLDDPAKNIIRKHSRLIANELDEIATVADVTMVILREKLFYGLTRAGLSGAMPRLLLKPST